MGPKGVGFGAFGGWGNLVKSYLREWTIIVGPARCKVRGCGIVQVFNRFGWEI